MQIAPYYLSGYEIRFAHHKERWEARWILHPPKENNWKYVRKIPQPLTENDGKHDRSHSNQWQSHHETKLLRNRRSPLSLSMQDEPKDRRPGEREPRSTSLRGRSGLT